ncbi:MAG TPA: ribonuclease III [Bacteroidales bacterium]|nr:ribonuclease III [Bacteroidales bacterium]
MNIWPWARNNSAGQGDRRLRLAIRSILGYSPRNIHLYHLAFLHRSATQEAGSGIRINNERLEFLGDAILDAVVADFLFKTFPTRDEGFLTEMRSKIVSRVMLGKISQKMAIDQLVQHDTSGSGTFRSLKGDALEALIGAVYLDRGYDFTKRIILDRIIARYFNLDDLVNQEVNHKSKIIEWSQQHKKQAHFQVVEEVGSGFRKQYIVELSVGGEPIARGQDFSIKGAERNAAEKGWLKISSEGLDL